MFKGLLKKVIDGRKLTEDEAKQAMDLIMSGEATSSQIASLITVLRFRGETIEEMTGFVRSMKEHAVTLRHGMEVMDTCGTGGDGASTFNISTASAIVLSSLGVKVAKHGNRAMSSKSGSADVLEFLGIPIQTNAEDAVAALRNKNMCFLFAPLYHVSMKHAASPRKEIGFRTIFNLLGPLANPANSKRQLIGVFDTNIAEKMAKTLRNLGTERAVFVTGGDGLDECSITTFTDIVTLDHGEITRTRMTPEDVGLTYGILEDIQVESVEESGRLISEVFAGRGNVSAFNTLVLNAGAGLFAAEQVESIAEGVREAAKVIRDGRTYDHLRILQENRKVEHHA
ncbi:MAG TPA: anthranilate phosphoribosyltransferase [Bacillales bacterium]|nr:anthranilate phosphoribosyltransferase [Bacillales bacterium]